MKKVIVLFFLINSILIYSNDTLRYHYAFEYIVNHNSDVKEVFKKLVSDSTNICVSLSNQIVAFNFQVFDEEIVDYEYGNADSLTKQRVYDSLNIKTKPFDYADIKCICWDNTFNFDNKCELMLFLGVIENNKMIAEIVLKHRMYNDYRSISGYGPVVMTFLFYFENDKVKKVFSKKLNL